MPLSRRNGGGVGEGVLPLGAPRVLGRCRPAYTGRPTSRDRGVRFATIRAGIGERAVKSLRGSYANARFPLPS